MDKVSGRPDYHASRPDGSSARLAVITHAEASSRASAANLSIALATRGKRVCLIATGNSPALPDQSTAASLEDLPAGRKLPAETLIDGPAGIRILPGGDSFRNFCQLDGTEQRLLVELLAKLETAFDYLIVETAVETAVETDGDLLHIYRAAPLILLTVTPAAESLTGAFSLLRALKRDHLEQPVHIIVDQARNLPNAHDTFKKLHHAAEKYLQLKPQYLGYFPSPQCRSDSVVPNYSVAGLYADPPAEHHLAAIIDRFCAIAEKILPLTSLSSHFSRLCATQKITEKSPKPALVPAVERAETAGESLVSASPSQTRRQGQGELSEKVALSDAVRYASRLAEREARQKASP